MEDLVELIDIVSTLEEWAASQEFGKNAAYRPHVDCNYVRNCARKMRLWSLTY